MGRRWLEYTPRGDSFDPLTLRWATWVLVARTLPRLLWRHPFGRRPVGKDLRRYMAATGARVQPDHVFQEGLQIVYEYGWMGVVAVALFLGLVWHYAHGSGPFGVALVAWAVTMTGSITLRTWPFPLVGGLLLVGAWL